MDNAYRKRRGWVNICGLVLMLGLIGNCGAWAAGENDPASAEAETAAVIGDESGHATKVGEGSVALAAALVMGIVAIATAIAQARIGAAGMGAIAENPKNIAGVIMLVAIPETVAILGFVIAYLIIT